MNTFTLKKTILYIFVAFMIMASIVAAHGVQSVYADETTTTTTATTSETVSVISTADKAVSIAMTKKTAKYRSGYSGPTKFDCSGLVYYIYHKVLGYSIPRSSSAMAAGLTKVSTSDLQVGDLVFFHTVKGRKVGHVALYIGDNKVIHATSPRHNVQITNIKTSKYWKTRIVSAARIA